MKVDLVVRNALIVSPEGSALADIVVDDGKIAAIGTWERTPSAHEVVDAAGRHVIPGAIDVHVHLRDPGMTHKEDWGTGTAAAAGGGVTTVFDMPNTDPATATLAALQTKREAARRLAHVDYGIYGVLDGSSIENIETLADSGVIGFKCFMAESTGELPTPDDGIILEGFERLARTGARCSVHAENAAIITRRRDKLQAIGRTDPHAHLASRPAICEIEAVGRAILLAEWTGARLHIAHESSKDALFLIRDAKKRGVDVTVETCPQYLLLDSRDVDRLGGQLRVNPPIREPGHAEELWQALIDGTIDMIATDHAPHTADEKLCCNIWDCSRGIPGVETQMSLMLTQVNRKRVSINDYVRWSAVNPAKAWNLYPQKGVIAVGSDADLVVVDMTFRGTIDQAKVHSRHKFNPWHGRRVEGRPVCTIVRGRIVVLDGILIGSAGWGLEVRQNNRSPSSRNVQHTTASILERAKNKAKSM
jgi:allantoinase